jgi:hypothetical protein
MNSYFVQVTDDDDIMQGDIIRTQSSATFGRITWGFIITADCDIAQKKSGDRYTWLEIITANDYLEKYWAAEQLRRLVEKQSKNAAESLNSLIRRTNLELSPLTPRSLCNWLADRTPDEIVNAITSPNKTTDLKVTVYLHALRTALGHEAPSSKLERLRSSWTILGRDEKSQQSQIREAFDADRGFPDFFFVPELPRTGGYGFVIMLRSISSLSAQDLYSSELEARINDRPDAFYRIGRLSDGVRFAVAQKLAFLFSRIGMPSVFERACESAIELVVESVCAPCAGER